MDIIKRINKSKSIWEILRELDVDELEEILKLSSDSYYNSGISLISDTNYDVLSDRLKELNPKSSFFKKVGAPVRGKKVKLKHELPSMDKIKTEEELQKRIKGYNGQFLVMAKLDGVSGMETDNAEKLFTRGDGIEGQDITHLTKMIKMFDDGGIPEKYIKKYDDIDARGELIIEKEVFDKKYSQTMANARNMVAGIVNSKPESINKKHANDVDYVVYEIIEPSKIIPSDQLKLAEKMEFNVVKWDILDTVNIGILDALLKKWKKNYKYEIDGLIVMEDQVHVRPKIGNPKYAFAYKGKTETAITKVTKVVWKPSKDGYIIPTIHYKPVQLSGATLQKTLGFNARFIKKNKIGKGAEILMIRSGDTIPYIKDVVTPAPKADFPDYDYTWDKTKVNIIIVNASENQEVIIRRLTKFVTNIGVDNMSKGIITRLVEAGYDTIPKIITIKKSNLLKIDGIKETLADKLITNLHNSLDKLDLLTLMVASNCFGRGFGERQLKKILNVYPDIVDKYNETKRNSWTKKLIELDGFDIISVDKFLNSLPAFQEFYELVIKIRPIGPYVNTTKTSGIFTGETIAFTGFREPTWKKYVETEGGKVTESVSGNTTLVVYNDGEEFSAKYLKAKKLGIKMMPKSKFGSKYGLKPSK